MYEIEKNVEMPRLRAGKEPKYPFENMEVGDSFFVEGGNLPSIRSSAAYARKRYNAGKFKSTEMDGGVRCWRVK